MALAIAQKSSGVRARKANPYSKKALQHQRAAKYVEPVEGGIHERAMLMALTVHYWGAKKQERGMAEAVAKENKADASMFGMRKSLIHQDAVRIVANIHNEMRETHRFLTLPWDDSGYRILSADGYFNYVEKMNALIEKYNTAADDLAEQYDGLVHEAKKLLGDTFNVKQYPSRNAFRAMYGASIHPRSLSPAEDFRVQMSGTEVALIKQQIKNEQDDLLKSAHRSVWERLSEVLTNAVERLHAKETGVVNLRSVRSSVEHIQELLEIVPTLNVLGDPKISEFAGRIRKEIAAYSPETLKDDAGVREKVIDAADDILKKMEAFMA